MTNSDTSNHDITRRLAKTVLHFQDLYLSKDAGPAGLLCQVWLPEVDDLGRTQLKTKGLPFCVAGTGDLLALFRCISCRFAFPIDDPSHLGAPGRVFNSGEPELACNVQHYPNGAYLRRAEAEQCQVQSSMLLPVFVQPQQDRIASTANNTNGSLEVGGTASPAPVTVNNSGGHSGGSYGSGLSTVAVLEVVQTSDDMQFLVMAATISEVLERCQLYTSSADVVKKKLPTRQSNLLLPNRTGVLTPLAPIIKDGSGDGSASADGGDNSPVLRAAAAAAAPGTQLQQQQQQEHDFQLDDQILRQQQILNAQLRQQQQQQQQGGADDDDASGSGSEDISMGEADSDGMGLTDNLGQQQHPTATAATTGGADQDGATTTQRTTGGGKSSNQHHRADPRHSKGRGSGNPGKPGTKLQLKDLQSQFGVGLKEAAARLGICPTTLKRACRRHGIQRWPRRALQKVNIALDEMEKRQREGGFGAGSFHPVGAVVTSGMHLGTTTTAAAGVSPASPGADGMFQGLGGDTRWTTLASFIPAFQSLPGPNGGGGLLMGMPALPAARGGGVGHLGGSWPPPATNPPPWMTLPPAQQQQQQQKQMNGGPQPAASDSSLPSGMVVMGGGGGGASNRPQHQQQQAQRQQQQQALEQQQLQYQQQLALFQQQQQRWANGNIVPSFLRPDGQFGAGAGAGAGVGVGQNNRSPKMNNIINNNNGAPNLNRASAPPRSMQSIDSKLGDPVLRLPTSGFPMAGGGVGGGEFPSLSEGFQGLSQLSIPSLGMGFSFPGASGLIGGSTLSHDGGAGGGKGEKADGGHSGGGGDDIGLLDSTILEFLLNE